MSRRRKTSKKVIRSGNPSWAVLRDKSGHYRAAILSGETLDTIVESNIVTYLRASRMADRLNTASEVMDG